MARKDGPRNAVLGVCTRSQQGAENPEAELRENLEMVDRMARQAERQGWKLDLAVLPEVTFKFAKDDLLAAAEDTHGKTVATLGARARELGIHLTAPVLRRVGDRVYNSVILLDRHGRPAGTYDKVAVALMADDSLEFGVTPGGSYPVFDLDIGRVGIQICYDVSFEEGWRALGNQDAELVLLPTNPAVPLALRGYAWRHGYYVAASAVHPPSVIVDPVGRVVATTVADREVAVARIDLDYRVLSSPCLWSWSLRDHPEYQGRVRIDWSREAHEYLVTSLDPALPIRKFLEAEGLTTGHPRLAKAREAQRKARGGDPVISPLVERD